MKHSPCYGLNACPPTFICGNLMPCVVLGSDAIGRAFVHKVHSVPREPEKAPSWRSPTRVRAQTVGASPLVRIRQAAASPPTRGSFRHNTTLGHPRSEGTCSAPGSRTEPEVGVCMALSLQPSHPSPHTATTAVSQTTFIFSKSPLTLRDNNSTALLSCGVEGKSQAAIRQTRLEPSHL